MILEYDHKYDDNIKELLYELQEYIMNIDIEGYNYISQDFKDEYFSKIMKEISDYQGKILLYEENNKILGLIVGCINNEKIDSYDFKVPKRGRITEFIVSKKYRNKKIGVKLFSKMEEYLKEIGCEAILIGVFAYNELAKKFYEKNNYHLRMTEMIKANINTNEKRPIDNKYSEIDKARDFCQRVKDLAKDYNLPFFIVTDGASAISNNGCEAVKNARDNHIKWELDNGYDPYENWNIKNNQ